MSASAQEGPRADGFQDGVWEGSRTVRRREAPGSQARPIGGRPA